MSNRVLFIDDDRVLLRTLERNFCLDFEVSIAESLREALQLFENQGTFAVIVVDMLMPDNDGLQTIKKLREAMPDSMFIMLTGKQEISTAIQAINEAQVFRYLSKPCEMDQIKLAIAEAVKVYTTAAKEKQLLLETMLGSVSVLTEFAELSSDRLVTPAQMNDRLLDIAEALSLSISSQDTVACKVLTIGLASMNAFERKRLKETVIFYPEHRLLLTKLCQHSAKIVSKLPQLSNVAEILQRVPNAETLSKSSAMPDVIATLLRIIFYWSLMDNNGVDREWISQCFKRTMPSISDKHWTCILHELGCTSSKVPRSAFVAT